MLRRRLGAPLFTASVIALGAACLSPTQIRVALEFSGEGRRCHDVAIFVNAVTDDGLGAPNATLDACAEGKLGDIVLLPGNQGQVRLLVVAGLGAKGAEACLLDPTDCIVARRKIAFRTHQSLELPITLAAKCASVPCTFDETCNPDTGVCESAGVTCVGGRCTPGGEADVGAGEAGTDAGIEPSVDAGTDGGIKPIPDAGTGTDGGTTVDAAAGACVGNLDCASAAYYCKLTGCVAPGVCTLRPLQCPTTMAPVCGCSGGVYPNACLAAKAGESYSGPYAGGPCAIFQ